MFQVLARHYDRPDAVRTCGQSAQIEAFARHFDVIERVPLPESTRELLLLTRKDQ
jgi:hypothetical protein